MIENVGHFPIRRMRIIAGIVCLFVFVALANASTVDTKAQSAETILQRLKNRVTRLASGATTTTTITTESSSSSKLRPEPCYPPPCDSVGYEKDTLQVRDKSKDNDLTAQEESVPAAHMVDGSRIVVNPMRFAPTTAPPPDKFEPDVQDPVIPNSVVKLKPPPDVFDAVGIEGSDDPSTPYGHMRQLMNKVKRLSKSVLKHEEWVIHAKRTAANVKELIQDTKESRMLLLKALKNLKEKKAIVLLQLKKDHLKGSLRDAKTALKELEQESSKLAAAGRFLVQAKENINSYIERTAMGIGLQKDEIQEKLQEMIDSKSDVAKIAKQYKEYAF